MRGHRRVRFYCCDASPGPQQVPGGLSGARANFQDPGARLQRDWITALDAEVISIQQQFEFATSAKGLVVIDNITDYLASYRTQIAESIDLIQSRMAHPENQGLQELVNRIDALYGEGGEIENAMWQLANS
jgi:hypothetical protein